MANKIEKIISKKTTRRSVIKSLGAGIAGVASVAAAKHIKKIKDTSEILKIKIKYAMLIDLRKCYSCKACAVACKSEFEVPLGVFRSQVIDYETEVDGKYTRKFLPWLCNHCDNPPCVDACPVKEKKAIFSYPNGVMEEYKRKATYKRPDGVVLVDYDRCIGCHQCVEACPYRARYVDPLKKAGANPLKNTVNKCTFCIHRVERGVVPSCVNTCPANARVFGNLMDKDSEIYKLVKSNPTTHLLIDMGTNPQVYYIEDGVKPDEILENGEDIRYEV